MAYLNFACVVTELPSVLRSLGDFYHSTCNWQRNRAWPKTRGRREKKEWLLLHYMQRLQYRWATEINQSCCCLSWWSSSSSLINTASGFTRTGGLFSSTTGSKGCRYQWSCSTYWNGIRRFTFVVTTFGVFPCVSSSHVADIVEAQALAVGCWHPMGWICIE
jgi:hypothetical protein